jgi:hypothetical protein
MHVACKSPKSLSFVLFPDERFIDVTQFRMGEQKYTWLPDYYSYVNMAGP